MGNVEIPNWLKGLPLAPVFRPTDTEFSDPIAYISKIEKEASAFGICKIIPPLPKPSKKYVFSNLNKSLSKCPDVGPDVSLPSLGSSSKIGRGNCGEEGELRAVFTTRQQELGQSTKRAKGMGNNPQQPIGHRQVWQSGEVYTLDQFEAKSKAFARSMLGMVKEVSPLAVESLFWKAAMEKPIYVDYANDVPGSAFGEPEGQSRYPRRRRKTRTRSSYQRQSEKGEAGDVMNPCAADSCDNRDTSARINISVSTCSESSAPLCSVSSDIRSAVNMKNCSNNDSSNEMEGSAGWKLSNSQWNLQVIARSAGSLTRFMPDDIPGVTSPMIYIGMLFSWFAWHVEDHELHSLNYLHMGSPKTWYSVPGDYALDFEEVIRMDAYGGNIDQLAALSRLGEKTTLVSPEVIVASGVPCYRLIQNPGEFVVTFPRAYHIGFSHGFNCGEAANFATPQWLRFAREAAVRRAAMNYLPMLSHQQLLYLLTMSFVSRVPRSLLPGARSSRLRDRQREEREILVKRAFVEDMQNENHLLSSLLEKDSTYHAVVWNPNVLPSLSKPTGLPDATSSALTPPTENIACDSSEHSSLLEELSFFEEAQNELDMENQEFFFDFQVDAGTLACVACGILGFPFMCVIQPSETATQERLSPEDVPDGRCFDTSHGDQAVTSGTTIRKGWSALDKLRRPRIFCLEHAIQVRELLHTKGGVNLLIICHSDYQKMKAYAAALAEETDTHFDCREIPLDVASQEDLHFIELAIVDDENDRYGKDWTSYLGINLRHCVRVRKNNPSKQVQHALSLGRLFSTEKSSPTSNAMRVKWKSRKSRSKPRADHPQNSESCKSLPPSEAILQKNSDSYVASKAKDIIQYTRRSSKSSYRNSKKLSSRNLSVEGSSASHMVSADIEHEVRVLEAPGDIDSEFLPAEVADSPASTSQYAGTVEVQVISQISDVMDVEEERCDTGAQDEEDEIETSRETSYSSPIEATLSDNTEIRRDKLGTLADLAEQTVYAKSRSVDDTRGNKMIEVVPQQADNDSSEMLCSLQKCKYANYYVGSVEECPGAAVGAPGGNKVSLYSPSGSALQPHMEENSGESIADKECNEASEKVQDQYSSDSAGSDREAMGTACTMSGAIDKKLESERRSSHELDENEGEVSSSEDQTEQRTMAPQVSDARKERKRKSEVEMIADNEFLSMGFVKSPCESLRPRSRIRPNIIDSEGDEEPKKKVRQQLREKAIHQNKKETTSTSRAHRCNLDGCQMSFKTWEELSLHKRNQCPHEGCGKKFSSHKYAVLHQRVHEDDRPLKCPWEGCRMSFKWAWARTEHIRVHTGERPYKCQVDGCGLSFRFISDYNRHRRKTGHYVS